MAIHTELSIHKTAEELLGLTLDLVRNIPRDLKQVIGSKLRDEALQVLVLIGRANMAKEEVSDEAWPSRNLDLHALEVYARKNL